MLFCKYKLITVTVKSSITYKYRSLCRNPRDVFELHLPLLPSHPTPLTSTRPSFPPIPCDRLQTSP